MIDKNSKIYIAGHNGMVGSACWRIFSDAGYSNLIGASSKELDLRNQNGVESFISKHKPKVIVNAAAKVGGILANNEYPYEFLMDNLLIQNNLIFHANKHKIPKLIFLGSSCIYPKFSPQPINEKHLLTSSLETTNQWYAIAKISGVKLIEALKTQYHNDYTSLMPTNLYGPNDNFDLKSSHVLPAMIRKFYTAKIEDTQHVELWGTGTPKREFMYVDDLASAVLFSVENKLPDHLYNVGTGQELSIYDLAEKIKKIIGYNGTIIWDSNKPDGTPRKIMDSSKFKNLGWSHKYSLDSGIKKTVDWYIKNKL